MRSGLGLLFADALIDGVLIVNQMRATHTIFHCTCTVQSIAGWIAGTGTLDRVSLGLLWTWTCDNKRATYVANNYLGLQHAGQETGDGSTSSSSRLWRRSRQVAKPSQPAYRSRLCGQFMRKAVRDREIGRSADR